MRSAFDQLLQFLQQSLSAIFRFIETVWAWAAAQIQTLSSGPWQAWALNPMTTAPRSSAAEHPDHTCRGRTCLRASSVLPRRIL